VQSCSIIYSDQCRIHQSTKQLHHTINTEHFVAQVPKLKPLKRSGDSKKLNTRGAIEQFILERYLKEEYGSYLSILLMNLNRFYAIAKLFTYEQY